MVSLSALQYCPIGSTENRPLRHARLSGRFSIGAQDTRDEWLDLFQPFQLHLAELIVEHLPLPPIEGSLSSMEKRNGLLQGTLDMLILRTLLAGAAHGHEIGKHIQRTTNDFLQMQHGSLYPALHRLEKRGWVTAKWETAPDRNREFKYYRLTNKGKKQLVVEESQWKQMAEAVALVMWPAAGES